jgi:CBS domain-containing protein
VVGVFTEKDYFEKFLSDKLYQKINPHNVSVGEIATMSPELVTVFPDDTVLSCMELMSKNVRTYMYV